jgi:hypothetical protein
MGMMTANAVIVAGTMATEEEAAPEVSDVVKKVDLSDPYKPWDETDRENLPFVKVSKDVAGGLLGSVPGIYAPGTQWVLVVGGNLAQEVQAELADGLAQLLRHKGCVSVVAQAFEGYFEYRLKRYGILPLTFAMTSAANQLEPTDRISIKGLGDLFTLKVDSRNLMSELVIGIKKSANRHEVVFARHSVCSWQIPFFLAGSAEKAPLPA